MSKILIVDDEDVLCQVLQFNLEIEGYSTVIAHSAEEVLRMDLKGTDLILLDIMMEGIDGFHLARILKKDPATASIPIIFCTAKDTENDVVAGFTLGADDYVTKPYSVREVMARVKNVLRRNTPATDDIVGYKDLILDLERKVAFIGGQDLHLTKKEYEVLLLLLRNPGKVFSRDDFLSLVWEKDVIVTDRSVDVTLARLRKKLGPYEDRIVTRHGYGYFFEA